MAKKPKIEVPLTKIVERVAVVLNKDGYLGEIEKDEVNRKLTIGLKYTGKTPVVMGIRRISTPGARIYKKVAELPRVWGGLGVNIISTPKGIMSDKEAKKLKCGGELLAQVW
jgi:small subunit ribosomal protein S8